MAFDSDSNEGLACWPGASGQASDTDMKQQLHDLHAELERIRWESERLHIGNYVYERAYEQTLAFLREHVSLDEVMFFEDRTQHLLYCAKRAHADARGGCSWNAA